MSSDPLPAVNSFLDIPQASRETSAASLVETPPALPSGVYQWRLRTGWQVPLFSRPVGSIRSGGQFACAKSDTHPDVVADLLAEYLTDTILRIDAEALVDLSVMVKQDLVVVTGEVSCSHPAKEAIVHSDPFIATLNGSIRDVLRDIGFSTPPPVALTTVGPVSPPIPTGGGSPRRAASAVVAAPPTPAVAPSSPNGGPTPAEDENLIDPAQVHIIIALTPAGGDGLSESVVVRATAGNEEASTIARKVEQKITEYMRTTGAVIHVSGGVVVEVELHADHESIITVSLNSKTSNDTFISDMADNALNPEFLKSLSDRVTDETIVVVRSANRSRMTGHSGRSSGKDWGNPERYGYVLARLQALHLIEARFCSSCQVELRFSQSGFGLSELQLVEVRVAAFEPKSLTNKELAEIVTDSCVRMSLSGIRENVFKQPDSSFFSLNHGGSVCNHEFIRNS